MKKTTTKLVFKRETLQMLSVRNLTKVAGGSGNSHPDESCVTDTTKIALQSLEK
jgi:hypothetical protein